MTNLYGVITHSDYDHGTTEGVYDIHNIEADSKSEAILNCKEMLNGDKHTQIVDVIGPYQSDATDISYNYNYPDIYN